MRTDTGARPVPNAYRSNDGMRAPKRKALTAVAAKVAGVAYAIIKNDTDYRFLHGIR